ncbi:DNA sulfur modification protein DndB [Geoalkalibacter halelectricus]|uniref:DNA sulfur modification protein DndB n=1 Tax=Geoalkalibacter halelectricus TaxID=2847045 RepID=UPI00266F2553|nr:DNA sulfur modification protein DndB [Geoalkalibacter halelectricus]MDO3380393.1 DNA sulfur modification protein DndB [Geoalkalibacter halelectricus]
MNVTYTFPATKGFMAGKEFFTATIPFKFLVRLFRFDSAEVPAELRAQRKINEGRAQKIADYILSNPGTYVLPAITASCDKGMTFQSMSDEHALGLLQVPLDSTLLINDGQHRHRGIALALEQNPALADEGVSVTLFWDQGLASSQQMFSDINANAAKPSGSINALYDLRNPFAQWVMEILGNRPAIKARIDMEAASPAKKSSKLWSLVAFHTFVNLLTGINAKNIGRVPDLSAKTAEVCAFLDALDAIPYWQPMLASTMSAEDVRENLVISHAVFLHALGILGAHTPDLSRLSGLGQLDPSKAAPLWQGRCVLQGKMRKTTDGVKSTAAVLMKHCGVDMPEDIARLDALCLSDQAQAA